MCHSRVGQLFYGLALLAALALTAVAFFTPGWRNVDRNDAQLPSVLTFFTDQGIFRALCRTSPDNNDCGYWWNTQPVWNRCVAVSLALAMIAQVVGLAWNLLACFPCCDRRFLLYPLTALAILASILVAIAVGVFGANNRSFIDKFEGLDVRNKDSFMGFSFYVACGALALNAIAVAFAVSASCCIARPKQH